MITSISTDWGTNPRIVRITTTDTLNTVISTGYVESQQENIELLNNGEFTWQDGDLILIFYNFGDGFFTYDPLTFSFIPTSDGQVTTVLGTENEIDVDSTDPYQPVVSIAPNPIIPGTGALTIPEGDTAEETAPINGIRFNTDTNTYDLYYPNIPGWQSIDVAGGNVISNGEGTTGQIPLYTSDGYHIGVSSLTDNGSTVSTPELVVAQAYVAEGSESQSGTGTIQVFSGESIVLGTSTIFTQEMGPGSAIKINGVSYTVLTVLADTALELTTEYVGISNSGLPFFIDAPFFTGLSGASQENLVVTNWGSFEYPNVAFTTYAPRITPINDGGPVSGFSFQADLLVFNYSSSATVTFNASGSETFQIDGSGDISAQGNLTLGTNVSAGQSIFMPTDNYNTYSPSIVSSNSGLGGYSYLTFNVDNFAINLDPAGELILNNGGTFNVGAPGNILNFQPDGSPTEFGGFALAAGDIVSHKNNGATAIALTIDEDNNPQIAFADNASNSLTWNGQYLISTMPFYVTTPITLALQGTVTVVNGSPTVTGSGTQFNAQIEPMDQVSFDGGVTLYSVLSVDSATQITLASNYGGSGASGILIYGAQAPFTYYRPAGNTGISPSGYFYVNELPAIPQGLPIISGLPMFGGVVNNNNDTLILVADYYGAGSLPYISTLCANGEQGAPTAVNTDNALFGLIASGYDGTNYQIGGILNFGVYNTVSAGVVPTELSVSLSGSTGTQNDVFNVNGDGVMTTLHNTLDDGTGDATLIGTLVVNTQDAYSILPNQVFTIFGEAGTWLLSASASGNVVNIGANDLSIFGNGPSFDEYFRVNAFSSPLAQVTTLNNLLDNGIDGTLIVAAGTGYAIALTNDGSGNAQIDLNNTQAFRFYTTTTFDGIFAPAGEWDVIQIQTQGNSSNGNYKGYSLADYDGTSMINILPGVKGSGASMPGWVTLDLPGTGNWYFWDNMEVSGTFTADSDAIFETYLSIISTVSLPPTPVASIQLFSQQNVETSLSEPYYMDESGSVYALGNGSGSGTVTLIDTHNGILGGPITTAGTLGLDPTWLYYNDSAFNVFAGGAGNITLSGTSNTGIGSSSLYSVTTGSGNTGIGASSLYYMTSGSGNVGLGTGAGSTYTAITQGVFIGDSADSTDESISYPLAIGASAKAGAYGISLGYIAGNSSTGMEDAIFIGNGTDSNTDGLTNVLALGTSVRVNASNNYIYGIDVQHGFNNALPLSTIDVIIDSISGPAGGGYGGSGVLRTNGIYDESNNWPQSSVVRAQNAVITDGPVQRTVLAVPLSNGYNGCVTQLTVYVSAILGNGGPGISGAIGSVTTGGMFDGTNYWINGSISATPVPITLNLMSTDTTLALASAQVAVTSGSLLVQVTGVNGYYVNWNVWCEYFTTVSVSNT